MESVDNSEESNQNNQNIGLGLHSNLLSIWTIEHALCTRLSLRLLSKHDFHFCEYFLLGQVHFSFGRPHLQKNEGLSIVMASYIFISVNDYELIGCFEGDGIYQHFWLNTELFLIALSSPVHPIPFSTIWIHLPLQWEAPLAHSVHQFIHLLLLVVYPIAIYI